MIERVRRVVTGEPEPGESTFTHVEEVEPLVVGGSKFYGVWGYDEAPRLPHAPAGPYTHTSMFPPPGSSGLRINAVTYPPKGEAAPVLGHDAAGAREQLLHAVEHGHRRFPEHGPGMHRTDSVDVGVVVSGKIGITNTDGTTEVLEPGDVYVQNGAPHAWEGLADEPSTIVFLVLGAGREED
jgi:hypothetical protein